jgi:hypothetical protein
VRKDLPQFQQNLSCDRTSAPHPGHCSISIVVVRLLIAGLPPFSRQGNFPSGLLPVGLKSIIADRGAQDKWNQRSQVKSTLGALMRHETAEEVHANLTKGRTNEEDSRRFPTLEPPIASLLRPFPTTISELAYEPVYARGQSAKSASQADTDKLSGRNMP